MKILITGATGFVGGRLCQKLNEAGHILTALSRNAVSAERRVPSLKGAFSWSPLTSPPPREAFSDVDAVIHLAGEIIAGRWTTTKKQAIRDSRVLGTRHLVDGIEGLESKPKVLISASAMGYYGDRAEEILTEDSPSGTDFTADLGRAWEGEAARAESLGLRVVKLRSSLVMGLGGGSLGTLLPLFKFGLGGPLGSGRQWWSWVHIDDYVGLVTYALENEISGPLNVSSPHPVRQKEFARILGRVLNRPAFFPAPSFALKVVLGEFASELLGSKRLLPKRVEEVGYSFLFPELEPALRQLLL